MNLEDLSKEFMQLEFKKNFNVNYIVRCIDVGDEEEIQILEKMFEDIKITNEIVPQNIRDIANDLLEKCINKYNDGNIDEACGDLEPLLELLKPYITWSELYESNFDIWECLVCEDEEMLEEILKILEEIEDLE